MTSKHTPGPWALKLGTYGAPHEISWAPGKAYGLIARINTPSFDVLPEAKLAPEVEANARLIAEAPAMLEALQIVTSLLEDAERRHTLIAPTRYGEQRAHWEREAKAARAILSRIDTPEGASI